MYVPISLQIDTIFSFFFKFACFFRIITILGAFSDQPYRQVVVTQKRKISLRQQEKLKYRPFFP